MAEGPTVSRRGRDMPASPIRKLAPYADGARKRGVRVYHLNIGQPDIETPREMLDAYRSLDEKVVAYGPSGGLADYVEALAAHYRGIGIDVGPEDLLVTTGGSEAILFALQAVADVGDEVIVPEPFYTNYNGFAVMSGVEIVPVTARAEDGFALPPIEEFERKIGPRTRAILLCNPGNPTGAVYERGDLEALGRLARERGLFLIADEVYRTFVYDDGVEHTSVLELEGLEDRTIFTDSVSKQYSACGSRVGCVATRNGDLVAAMLKFAQARLCPPTVDQIAARAALSVPASYFDEVRDEYRRRRDILCEALGRIPGLVCQKPRGAFYTVARLPIPDAEQFAVFLLEEFEDAGETVMVAPAAGFYATPGKGLDEVRIAYVLACDDLRRAMEVFGRGLEVWMARVG